MSLIALGRRERVALEELAAHTAQARELRRAQAVLWLDAAEPVSAVAKRLGVTRQTLYNWAGHFHRRRGLALTARPTHSIERSADAACRYLLDMRPQERLQKAGIFSGNFWLSR
jgi:transposase